jgi:SAM-dependent methyltransferase
MQEQSNRAFNQQDVVFSDPIAAAKYDKQIYDSWIRQLERWVGRSTGLDILEVGPGIALGTQILLAERGNRVTVADPFPPRWHDTFHPFVYEYLATLNGGSAELGRSARAGTLDTICVRQIAEPAEDLHSLKDREFDVVLSNAVLEHMHDLDRVCSELARVTKTGGANIHQIDLGYHKNRDRPLDHLLMSDSEFYAEANAAHFEYGNRWRASEFIARFESAGLEVNYAYINQRAESEYLTEVHRKIRKARRPYAYWPTDDLGVLSLLVVARRHPAPRSIGAIINGRTAVAIQFARKLWGQV